MDNSYGYDSWDKNPFLADDTPTQPIDKIMESGQEGRPVVDEDTLAYKIGYNLGAGFAILLLITGILIVFAVFAGVVAWLLS